MTQFDFHPEKLLDGHALGCLDPAESALLEEHLRQCPTCRLELEVRDDFAAALSQDAPEEPSLESLVEEVVRQTGEAEAAGQSFQSFYSANTVTRGSSRPRRQRTLVVIVAASAMLVGVAAAATYLLRVPEPSPREQRTRPERSAPALKAIDTPHGSRSGAVDKSASPDDEPAGEAAKPEDGAEPKSDDGARRKPIVHAKPGPAELFAEANRARRAGDPERAVSLYKKLQQGYPESSEAKVSYTIMGQLLMHERQPEAALKQFDDYLGNDGTGALSEEALIGRARALRQMGKQGEERATLQQLLKAFPHSIHVPYARQRLTELTE